MRAIQLTSPSLSAFQFTDLPEPRPGRGEVLLRLHGASLNFIDLAVATGQYPGPTFPLIPVADGAGEVVEVGDGVSLVKPGDRVMPHPKSAWIAGPASERRARVMRGVNRPGSLCEYAVESEETLVPIPAHLDFIAAATLPIVATTAWNALQTANIGPGSTVLLLGTGGVSIAALQLAKAAGARIIITSSSDEKLDRAKALGADLTINYRQCPAWDLEVLRLTDGQGVELIIETGGADTFSRSLNAAAHGGTVFTIGFLSGANTQTDLFPIIVKGLRVQGSNTGSVENFRAAVRAIAAAGIEPVIDRVFDLENIAAAYKHLAAGGRHFGKLAIRTSFP